jgi:hypothetical protein
MRGLMLRRSNIRRTACVFYICDDRVKFARSLGGAGVNSFA